jgi:hypothetical protein
MDSGVFDFHCIKTDMGYNFYSWQIDLLLGLTFRREILMRGRRFYYLIAMIVFCGLLISADLAMAQLSDDDIAALRERGEKEGWTFTVGRNPATEIPLDELCGAVEPPPGFKEKAPHEILVPKADLPERFDWREVTGCPPIRNQGQCGSCWAFSTVGTMECAIKVTDDQVVNLSEQWLVSCNPWGHSCDGGYYCFDLFTNSAHDPCGGSGAVMETDFPYVASDAPCNCPYPHRYFIDSWGYVGDYQGATINQIKQAILDHGPISSGVYASDAMQSYNGGVFNVDEGQWTNHLVVLVGWDDTMGTNGCWIMRNSWGSAWGDDGYMYIEYGVSMIGSDPAFVVYHGVQRVGLGETEFSDDLGDGDGILEGGETIQLTCAVANLGPDTVTDVSMELSIDDPTLTITNGSGYLGTIPSGDSLSNAGAPFEFTIPEGYIARICGFTLAVTWNCGPGCDTVAVDTMTFESTVGKTSLLLVDDDDGDSLQTFYKASLYPWRVPSDRWDVAVDGQPSGSDLAPYDVVIWYTGDYRPDPLSGAGIDAMISYLDAGGNLVLTGQGIAAELGDAGPAPKNLTPCDMEAVMTVTPTLTHDNLVAPLLGEYLKAQYVKTQYVPVLTADTSGDIFAPGDSIMIQGIGGASNQTQPDHVMPINGGKGEMKYLGMTTYGMISYAGSYRSLFLSFGFEAIENRGTRWHDRDSVLTDLFDFFAYPMPGATYRSGGSDVEDDMPLITSSESLKKSPATCTYAYQLYADSDLTVLVASDVGLPEGSGATTSWQPPSPLTEDEDYYWRVRADQDGDTGIWSPAAAFWVNAVNQPPGVFSSIAPADGAVAADLQPTFVWHRAIDPDRYDTIVEYRLYYSPDADFATADSVISLTDTLYAPPSPIDIGGASTCYWKVTAFDGFGGATACQQVFQFHTAIIGDANGDGTVNIGDAVFLINHIFKGGPGPDPEDAGDANCDGSLNIADAVHLVEYIFRGGPPPGCP